MAWTLITGPSLITLSCVSRPHKIGGDLRTVIDSPPDRLDNTGSLCYKQAPEKLAGWRLKHKLMENTDSQCELTSLAQKLLLLSAIVSFYNSVSRRGYSWHKIKLHETVSPTSIGINQ